MTDTFPYELSIDIEYDTTGPDELAGTTSTTTTGGDL